MSIDVTQILFEIDFASKHTKKTLKKNSRSNQAILNEFLRIIVLNSDELLFPFQNLQLLNVLATFKKKIKNLFLNYYYTYTHFG